MAKSVLHTIEDNLSTFSKGQKRIGRYILDHYDQAAFMTASKLGKLTEVSESTVVRFAAELGFDGYPAMQKALQEMARNRLTSTQRIQAAENIYDRDVLSSVLQADIENLRQISMDEDRDTFQTAVEKIVHARHIYILGARSSTHLAGYLYFYMQMIFENVTLVQASAAGEIFEQLFRSGEGDVMIAFSFPRYSKDTINAARFARSRGAEIIAMLEVLLCLVLASFLPMAVFLAVNGKYGKAFPHPYAPSHTYGVHRRTGQDEDAYVVSPAQSTLCPASQGIQF